MFIPKTPQNKIITQELKQQQYSSSPKSSPQISSQTFSESLENMKREFRSLTADEQEEYKEYYNDLFYREHGSMLNYALYKIFAKITPSSEILNKDKANDFISNLFNNFKRRYTPDEELRLQNKYQFQFNAQNTLEANLYELNKIYNLDKSVLRMKSILNYQGEDDQNKFENRLMLPRIPYEVLRFTKNYFTKLSPLYTPCIERELKNFGKSKYSLFEE